MALTECPVCLEEHREAEVLPCGHSFCRDCIRPIATSARAECPVCRRPFGPDDPRPNFTLRDLILRSAEARAGIDDGDGGHDSGDSDQDAEECMDNILMVGNPGTGKSTLLNGLIGQCAFKAGVSYGSGLTYQLQDKKHEGTLYMDTPGLSDDKIRKQAAEAITQALRRGGRYKVFFVCTLQQGRVRAEDAATIQLVLDAARELTTFGVIVNQVPPKQLREILATKGRPQSPYKAVKLALGATLSPQQFRGMRLHFNGRDDDLDCQENVVKAPPPELREFIARLAAVDVHSENVLEVEAEKFAKMKKELEATVAQLQSNIAAQAEEFRRREAQQAEHFQREMQRWQGELQRLERLRQEDLAKYEAETRQRQQQVASASSSSHRRRRKHHKSKKSKASRGQVQLRPQGSSLARSSYSAPQPTVQAASAPAPQAIRIVFSLF